MLRLSLVLSLAAGCGGEAAPGSYRGVHDAYGAMTLTLDRDGHFELAMQRAALHRDSSRQVGPSVTETTVESGYAQMDMAYGGLYEARGDTIHFSGALPFRLALRREGGLLVMLGADSLLLHRVRR